MSGGRAIRSTQQDRTLVPARRKLGQGLGALLGESRREEPLAAEPDDGR